MATGRTKRKWIRVYSDGYDLSGFSRSVGPLELSFEEADLTAIMSDQVKGYLRNMITKTPGALNAVFDNTVTTGIHTVARPAGSERNLLVAYGIRAAPAEGDPVYGGLFLQKNYKIADDGGAVTANIDFGGWSALASKTLATPWGILLHPNQAETGANTANGHDNPTGAATTKGGLFIYQVLAATPGSGTATILVDDSADNSAWLALSGATSGVIACDPGVFGSVALGSTATVRRYLRWQINLGTATSVTFVSAFFRAY